MDNENMNTNEVIEAADQIVEESDGLNGKDVAVLGAGVALVAAAGYGIYQLGKKAKAAIKRHKLVKQAKQEIEDGDGDGDTFEEFEDGDEEIHVVK